MFKKVVLSGLVLTFFSLSVFAQQNTTPDKKSEATPRVERNRGDRPDREMPNPETRARKMTDRATQELNLDKATSQKFYDVTLAHAKKVDAIRKGSDDRDAKKTALKANADTYKATMKGILSPDQFAKLEAMKKEMRHHGKGGAHGKRSHT